MTFEESKFLIICGQQKVGITSLFAWLSLHPDMCPSVYKEFLFFLVQCCSLGCIVVAWGITLHGQGAYPAVAAKSVSRLSK